MYVPKHFELEGEETLARLMARHSFGQLVTVDEGGLPFVSHLPFMYDADRGAFGALSGHMAKANPQWKHFQMGREVLVAFQGPHAYISPNWYEARDKVVPTWNYVAVHAYGVPKVIEGEAARAMLDRLVRMSEAGFETPWRLDSQGEDFLAAMERGITAFEIALTRIEAKGKLAQNRSEADRQGVISGLRSVGGDDALELADWTEETLG